MFDVEEAMSVIEDKLRTWEDHFTQYGRYPDDWSPELSEALAVALEMMREGREE